LGKQPSPSFRVTAVRKVNELSEELRNKSNEKDYYNIHIPKPVKLIKFLKKHQQTINHIFFLFIIDSLLYYLFYWIASISPYFTITLVFASPSGTIGAITTNSYYLFGFIASIIVVAFTIKNRKVKRMTI